MKSWKELERRLKSWALGEKQRLIAAAALLAVSLGLFFGWALARPSGAVQVARRYMEAAFDCDYMELYGLFDEAVLDRELERYGMDRAGMEDVARKNGALVEEYVVKVQTDYGVTVSFRYELAGERVLTPDELSALAGLYAADGFQVDILEARQVAVRATAQLAGADSRQTLERELEITAIRTPKGWSLDRDSMYAVWALLYDLPAFAQENFGA